MEKLNPNTTKGKVPFISKLAYGFGDVGCNFSWSFVVSFLNVSVHEVWENTVASCDEARKNKKAYKRMALGVRSHTLPGPIKTQISR